MFLEGPGFHFLRPIPPLPLLFDQPLILVLLLFCTSYLVQTGNGELPVVKHKAAFLYHINKYRNTCIHVETGWGKSTQVPQFIMGDYNRYSD